MTEEEKKKRLAALDELAKKSRARAKKTLAKQDMKKDIDYKIAMDAKIDKMVNKEKSQEDLEGEAYSRYFKKRLGKGILTKPYKGKK